jgi:hypothetical protein
MYGSSYMFRHYIAIFKERSLSTAPQLRISQKALGTLPEDGNVMPKHVRAAILLFGLSYYNFIYISHFPVKFKFNIIIITTL